MLQLKRRNLRISPFLLPIFNGCWLIFALQADKGHESAPPPLHLIAPPQLFPELIYSSGNHYDLILIPNY